MKKKKNTCIEYRIPLGSMQKKSVLTCLLNANSHVVYM